MVDPVSIALTVKTFAELGMFAAKAVIDLTSGAKTPEEVNAEWVHVAARMDKAIGEWNAAAKPGDTEEN